MLKGPKPEWKKHINGNEDVFFGFDCIDHDINTKQDKNMNGVYWEVKLVIFKLLRL